MHRRHVGIDHSEFLFQRYIRKFAAFAESCTIHQHLYFIIVMKNLVQLFTFFYMRNIAFHTSGVFPQFFFDVHQFIGTSCNEYNVPASAHKHSCNIPSYS